MTIDDFIELAKEGKLILFEEDGIERTRRKYIYNDNWQITGSKLTKYRTDKYRCKTHDMEENASYRLSKKDFKMLSNIIPEIYYYKGNKLYDIKKLGEMDSLMGHDFIAYWNDKDEDNKQKLGKFYLKDLIIKLKEK